MNKSLIALAVLGSFSFAVQAQTNVRIGGVIQTDLKSYKVGNTTRATSTELRVDDDYTSRFWIAGSEDLGGGLSAIFNIENRLNTDVNSAIGSGNGLSNGDTWLGLKGRLGQITFGKNSLWSGQGFVTEALLENGSISSIPTNMSATQTILSYVGNTVISNTRVPNVIRYVSPTVSGFTGSVAYSPNAGGNEGTVGNAGVGAPADAYSDGGLIVLTGTYSNGPIYLNLAYWNNKTEGRPVSSAVTAANPTGALLANAADTRAARFSGSYRFPFGLKVGLQYDRSSLLQVGRLANGTGGTDRTRTAWEIPVSYTIGKGTVLANYTRAGDISNTPGRTGAKLYTVGYDYSFSKRTNVGVFYSKLKNDAQGVYSPFNAGTSMTGSPLLAGESATTMVLSIKHTF